MHENLSIYIWYLNVEEHDNSRGRSIIRCNKDRVVNLNQYISYVSSTSYNSFNNDSKEKHITHNGIGWDKPYN